MFLLILCSSDCRRTGLSSFTFHDVSINTDHPCNTRSQECIFTFHDVSINTGSKKLRFFVSPIFTFHDVSINTIRKTKPAKKFHNFTFHDVSINTIVDQGRVMRYVTLHSTMFLLILDSDFKEMYSSLSSLHSTMFLLIPVSTGNGMR